MATARIAARAQALAPTVFSEFSALAQRVGAVNLGQGFPDFDGPEEVREAARRDLRDNPQQYVPSGGLPELRAAIAEHSARFHGQRVDPEQEVVVTCGATEAIFDAVLSTVGPGDEVVLFEPFYDSYAAAAQLAGASVKAVTLLPPDEHHSHFWFDDAALTAAFSARTRLVLLNTPHNPTGKVFTRAELERIGALAERHDAWVVSDEVYEHLVYAPARHVRIGTLPGMARRTVSLSSAGKTLAFTGWKVGWAIGPSSLIEAMQRVHSYVTFCTPGALQRAAAVGLRLPDAYFDQLARDYVRRRDRVLALLAAAALPGVTPEGSYFVLADIRGSGFTDDFAFCRAATEQARVAAIPPSAFYASPASPGVHRFARFAFCKRDETLEEAGTRLLAWRRRLP